MEKGIPGLGVAGPVASRRLPGARAGRHADSESVERAVGHRPPCCYFPFFDDAIRRPTAAIATQRNAYVAALADDLLIAHADRGGKTEALCKDALAQAKPVFTLDSPDNAHLMDCGAVPIAAGAPMRF